MEQTKKNSRANFAKTLKMKVSTFLSAEKNDNKGGDSSKGGANKKKKMRDYYYAPLEKFMEDFERAA